jgi:hypothetical protein
MKKMKVNDKEKQALSDAIDKMNEGLDVFIQLYNESEEDKPVIEFDEEVISAIEKAKIAFGEEEITKRINSIIKEVLALLPDKLND